MEARKRETERERLETKKLKEKKDNRTRETKRDGPRKKDYHKDSGREMLKDED